MFLQVGVCGESFFASVLRASVNRHGTSKWQLAILLNLILRKVTHLYGLSPVCVSVWRARWYFVQKDLLQSSSSHLNGLCERKCRIHFNIKLHRVVLTNRLSTFQLINIYSIENSFQNAPYTCKHLLTFSEDVSVSFHSHVGPVHYLPPLYVCRDALLASMLCCMTLDSQERNK